MMTKRILTLNLKTEYFNAIRAGEKSEEFREVKPYWTTRLKGREFDEIHILKGYPAKDRRDGENCLVRPWRGITQKVIVHPLFGPVPVRVYAITVN